MASMCTQQLCVPSISVIELAIQSLNLVTVKTCKTRQDFWFSELNMLVSLHSLWLLKHQSYMQIKLVFTSG